MSETTMKDLTKVEKAKAAVVGLYSTAKERVNIKSVGVKTGQAAAAVARPVLSFFDGVKDGWKNG